MGEEQEILGLQQKRMSKGQSTEFGKSRTCSMKEGRGISTFEQKNILRLLAE